MAYSSIVKPILFIMYGIGYMFLAEFIWRYYAANNPLLDWITPIAEMGHNKTFWSLIYFHDILLNTLIAFSLALPIRWFIKKANLPLLLFAFISAFTYLLLNMVNHASAFQDIHFTISQLATLIPIAIAYLLANRLVQTWNSN